LRAAPLVTSIKTGSQNLVAAACPQALALGLRPGMAISLARAQTPGLDIREADPAADLADLTSMATAFARRWSPLVMLDGEDGLFLEVTGVSHLFGGEKAMARRLIRLLARLGVTARIAIADTAGAAHALVRYSAPRHPRETGDWAVCPPNHHPEDLAPLPIEALRIEQPAIELLARLGVERIGQLIPMPRAPLVRRFGGQIVRRLDQALGNLPEPLDPVIPEQPIAVTRRFAEPILTADAIEHWLAALVPELVEALAEAGQGATRIELIADRIDGVPQILRAGLARPSRDPRHLLRLLVRRIELIEPGFGIDALALHVRRAGPLGAEPFTERLDEEAAPDLAPLVDTLATRIGLSRLWRMRAVESDVPERSAVRAPVLDPPERGQARIKPDDIRQLDRNPPLPPWHAGWPRPTRLLARPERLDHVMAELPDHAPRRFTWRGTAHKVIRADGPERVQGEWWKRAAEIHSVRDYFCVEDEAGRRYWLFRSGDGERAATGDLSWYLHGVFG
jgi:protein ImuB